MPLVGVVVGSRSDEPMVQDTVTVLNDLGISNELVGDYRRTARRRRHGSTRRTRPSEALRSS